MEKRLFIAVLISVSFLWIWGKLIPRFFPSLVPKPTPRVTAKTPARTSESTGLQATPGVLAATATGVAVPASDPVTPVGAEATIPGRLPPTMETRAVTTVVTRPSFVARFSNRGAQLVSFELRNYLDERGAPVELVKMRPDNSSDFPFALETTDGRLSREANTALYQITEQNDGPARVLRYRLVTSSGTVVEKVFRIGDELQFDFSVSMAGRVVPYRVTIGPGIRNVAGNEKDTQFLTTGNGLYQSGGSLEVIAREKAASIQKVDEEIEFIGIEDNYFLSALTPQTGAEGVFRAVKLPQPGTEARKEIYASINAEGGKVAGKAFFGPKQAEVLERFGLEKTLKFGMFGLISRFLLSALLWIYELTRNYGFAIIILTIVIKMLLYPLQHKSIVSMKKMQKVQPKMNAIRDRYKKAKTDADQRQKMNVEMMKLYQVEGINPMSGCWPILLQLPILWGFYSLLSNAIELRGADFIGWISDLSQKDPYYITPILMTATMFIQQAMTPMSVDPVQKKVFMMMPLIFGFIFKDFPSGLVLYWLVQNILTIIQQMIMNRFWKDHPAGGAVTGDAR